MNQSRVSFSTLYPSNTNISIVRGNSHTFTFVDLPTRSGAGYQYAWNLRAYNATDPLTGTISQSDIGVLTAGNQKSYSFTLNFPTANYTLNSKWTLALQLEDPDTNRIYEGGQVTLTIDKDSVNNVGQEIINNLNPANLIRSTVLTGLNLTLSGAISVTDTILQAFGKLQNQITDKIDLNGNNSAITYTNFTPSVAPSYQEGRVWYDTTTKSLSIYDNVPNTSIQVGKELVLDVRNNSGATIANGKVVYINGAVGQNPTVRLAQADSLSTSEIIGVATHDISNNTVGKVTLIGVVNDIDTSAFSDGQQVYLSDSTAGALTATPPASPNFVVFVGYVAHAHQTQGKLMVMSDRAMANNSSLGTSQTSFPTQKAVKDYVDTGLSTKANKSGDTFTGSVFAPQFGTTVQTLTPTGTTQSINWNNGQHVLLNLASATGNVTLTLSNPTAGARYLIKVTQGATARNLVFPTGTLQIGGGGVNYVGIASTIDIISVSYNGSTYDISVSRNLA